MPSRRAPMKITAYRRLASVLITALVALALAAAPGAAPAGAASDAPDTYVLPGTDVYPFGITVLGDQYYATGAINGVLYHGDLRERRASILVPPEQAVPHGRNGIIATGTRLIVTENGDGPPWVSIYQRRTGRLVARFTTGDARSFLAFPGLAPSGAVYVADASPPRLYRIPAQAITQQQAGLQPLSIYRYLRNTAIYEDPAGY